MHPFSLLTHPIIPHQTVHYLVLVFAVLLNSAAQMPSFFQQPEMVDPSKNGWFIMGNSIYKWMTGWSSWWFFATPLKNDGLRQSVGMMKFHSQLFLESLIKFHGSSHHQPDSVPHQDPRINQGQVSHPTVPLFGTMISFLSLYA